MSRSPLARTLTLVYALLHLLVPPLVAVADAYVQAEAASAPRPVMHAESEGTTRCPRVHQLDCGLCHAVAALALPARAEPLVPVVGETLAAPGDACRGRGATGRYALALPRAPPAS